METKGQSLRGFMETKGQSLRGSQYITTFGPGSILETPDGPVVIAAISDSQLFKERKPEDFEITDLRLSQTILSNGKIFRIPSNAELGINENKVVYHAYHFPLWSLCTTHGILYCYDQNNQNNKNNIKGCPECAKENTQSSKWQWKKSRQEAIRFVLACSAGHLDEVPWLDIIKHEKEECKEYNYLKWQGSGGSLDNVNLICPNCGQSVNFKQIYNKKFNCKGRFPEEKNKRIECKKHARIIQRGAANLRVVEIKSALTIPPLDTGLHQLLQTSPILDSIVVVDDINSKDILFKRLDKLVETKRLDKEIASKIKKYSEKEILQAIKDIKEITSTKEPKEETLRKDEFKSLRKAATEGAPPQSSNKPGGPNQFEVYQENVKLFPLASGRILRVTPVSRLRVVVVQVGYTRPIETNNDEKYSNFSVVPIKYVPENSSIGWYPGVELFGEGIFIDFVSEQETTGVSQHFELKGKAAEPWLKAYNVVDNYRKLLNIPGMHKNYVHPVFVWWHTLSHRLIKSLSIDSGYSSAAIRERVYTVNIAEKAEKIVGGLLLYTAQSGGDGTLGGLISLVPHFDRILQLALRDIHTCSNDPICIEENFAEDKVNGSACHACQFISETSCEHRNILLDRKLLLENLP